MRALTWDEFAEAAGSVYSVDVGDDTYELTLEAAEELASAGREGGSFRLAFVGPVDPVLPQAIYPFRLGEQVFDIFIVPSSRAADGTRYEATFF